MKFYYRSKPASAILCAAILLAASTAQAQSTLQELKSTIQDAQRKNIAFFSVVGGTSHYNWVLSIGEELGQRGHTFYFLSAVSLVVAVVESDVCGANWYNRTKMLDMVSLSLMSRLYQLDLMSAIRLWIQLSWRTPTLHSSIS